MEMSAEHLHVLLDGWRLNQVFYLNIDFDFVDSAVCGQNNWTPPFKGLDEFVKVLGCCINMFLKFPIL